MGEIGAARPIAIAHRAGNEITALKAAEAAGADLVEADVWFYRGAIEVRHLKTMGPVPLLWDRWKLVPASVPRLYLPELLRAAAPATELLFDLKGVDPLLPEVLMETVDDISPGRPFTVCSQSWDLLESFRDYPAIRVAHSVGNRRQLRQVWSRLTWHSHHMISIHFRLLSAAAVRALHEKASTVVTWPINTRERLDLVLGWGVDGFTTDSLELLREFVASQPSHGEAGAAVETHPHGRQAG